MVFKNRVMAKTFRPKKDEVAVECRSPHKEEFNDLYSSLNITRLIKSRRMREHTWEIGEVHIEF